MKNLIFIGVLFFSTSVFAGINWSDLETGRKYHLGTDIFFTENIKLNKDDIFVLQESLSDSIAVIMFSFKNNSCTDSKLASEMILFNPEPGMLPDKSVGISLEPNCEVTVFVEAKNFYDLSILEE